jgi:ribonuclease BN (tRNA processing enzyme)
VRRAFNFEFAMSPLIPYHRTSMTAHTHPENTDFLTFLGTAGARFMVSKQLAASGGMWLDLDNTHILLDPGPGCIVQVNKRKFNPENLDAIIVSHRHLDHAGDVNVMVEAMTSGGFKKHGAFFAPQDALDEKEPILASYLKKNLQAVTVLKEQTSYEVDGVAFKTSVRHDHSVETYGLIFRASGRVIGFLTDTRYFEELHKSYAGVELLIINMCFTEPIPSVAHLAIPDVERLLVEIKPKLAVLTHFGMMVWKARPWLIADDLTQKTGVKVIAARDGMKFDLKKLEVIPQRIPKAKDGN